MKIYVREDMKNLRSIKLKSYNLCSTQNICIIGADTILLKKFILMI